MKKSLIALAFGTLGLGISEFVMMGILSDVANDLHISITEAGHLISAYALGVCIGAPILVFARKKSLKNIILILASIIIAGNLAATLAPNYHFLLGARFLSGLPHGAYFGVGSIIASKLATRGKKSEAVSIMIAGMTFANLIGVPLGTSLSLALSWRVVFLLVSLWGIVILYSIWKWVPQVEGLQDTGFIGQFHFLKSPAAWLLIGATMLGNGGIFCWYSYINPLLAQVSGFPINSITFLMVLSGFGMVIGNLISGRLSDRFTPARVAASVQGLVCLILLALFFFSPISWASVLLMMLCTAGLFALSSPQQVLLIQYSKGGELLGAASVQMAFNLGNAIGAYSGGLVIDAGYSYQHPALLGVPFALLGFILLCTFIKRYESKQI